MKDSGFRKIDAFFEAISAWRKAYHSVSLHYLARQLDDRLQIVAARLHLDITPGILIPEPYRAGSIQAGQWDISSSSSSLSAEKLLRGLLSPQGCFADGHGVMLMAHGRNGEALIADPVLITHDLSVADRRRVTLHLSGAGREQFLPQPESDWILKAGELPYDSVQELCDDYGLAGMGSQEIRLEVVAQTPVQVFAGSAIIGTSATLGLWTATSLDKYKMRLGYRIVHQGKVILRGMVSGESLDWIEAGSVMVGKFALEVPPGASVQCISSYGDYAHQQQWIVDSNVQRSAGESAAAGIVLPERRIRADGAP